MTFLTRIFSRDSHPTSYWLFILSGLLFFSGCVNLKQLPPAHIVMFNAEGQAIDPCSSAEKTTGDASLCDSDRSGILSNEYREFKKDEYEAYLDRIFQSMDEHFSSAGDKKILLFVHGGLNTQSGSLDKVIEPIWDGETKELYQAIREDGYYPVFINWHSSLSSTYADHLLHVRQGEDLRNDGIFGSLWGYVTSPIYFGLDAARSVARAPLVLGSFLWNDFRTLPIFSGANDSDLIARDLFCREKYRDTTLREKCLQEVDKTLFKKPPTCFSLTPTEPAPVPEFPAVEGPEDNHIPISIGEDGRTCMEMGDYSVQNLVTYPVKAIATPFIDGFGTSAWSNMLRRINLLYHSDADFHLHADDLWHDENGGISRLKASGGLSIFMRRFVKYYDDKGIDPTQFEITLVGHSMGTIVLNEMIRNFGQVATKKESRESGLFDNIVYLAAASTVAHYEQTVLPYLLGTENTQFYNLTLHPVAERRETNVFDLSPRGSLLVWIDSFLSNPLTHRERTLGRYENFLPAVHNTPEHLRSRIHFKSYRAGEGYLETDPQTHSDLGKIKFWDPQCWTSKPASKDIQRFDEKPCYKRSQ